MFVLLWSHFSGLLTIGPLGSVPCNSRTIFSFVFGLKQFPVSSSTFNLGAVSEGSDKCVGGLIYSPALKDGESKNELCDQNTLSDCPVYLAKLGSGSSAMYSSKTSIRCLMLAKTRSALLTLP